MKLWIFNHYANGPGVNGVTRHFDLAKNLVKAGHEVTIFCSSFNHWNKEDLFNYDKKEFFKIESYEGVRFVYFKTTNYSNNGFKRILSMFSYYIKSRRFKYDILEEKPDYVMGSILHHFAALRAFKVSKKLKASFIFEERDLWPATLIDLGKVKKNNIIVKLLDKFETFMYKKSDKIVVLFENADKYVKSKGIDDNKILYLPNGVDVSRYKVTSKKEFNKENIVIGYVGAHSLANNMDRILELAEKMKDNTNVRFIFVGEGTYKSDMIKIAKAKGLKNCIFKSGVPKEQIPEILAECDFGIVSLKDSPLYNYGFSLNKLYDYMGARLPIILDTTIKDTFIERENIGISSSDLDKIKNFVENITLNQYLILSDNSYSYVSDNHDWDKLADKFYNSLMEYKTYEKN